jgi:hypothetical protein
MRGVARLFLIWLLAAVVPLKGVAAVTTLGCGPGHHGAKASAVSTDSAQPVGHHDGDRDMVSGRGDSSQEVVEAEKRPPDVPTQDDAPKQSAVDASKSFGKAAKLKCSGCAPCCAAAAPAFEPARVPRAELGSCSMSFEDTRFVGVVVDIPHRPPRLILA